MTSPKTSPARELIDSIQPVIELLRDRDMDAGAERRFRRLVDARDEYARLIRRHSHQLRPRPDQIQFPHID